MPTLLPKSSAPVRPRIAVEVRASGVVAARADDGVGVISQVASTDLPAGALLPSFTAANVVDAAALTASIRRAVGQVATGKGGDLTLIVPDAAVRVFLLDFDELPSKRADALGVLRFRLSKLLPIASDDAEISYQLMGRRDGALQVLAVAIPKDVLAEYELAVRDAGYEPGAVLPSSLAVAAALDETGTNAALLVNAGDGSLTTAIVRRGDLLLHRTVDLPAGVEAAAFDGEELLQTISVASAYFEDTLGAAPVEILFAGTFSEADLYAVGTRTGLSTRDVVQAADLQDTVNARVSRTLLAGVRGALKI